MTSRVSMDAVKKKRPRKDDALVAKVEKLLWKTPLPDTGGWRKLVATVVRFSRLREAAAVRPYVEYLKGYLWGHSPGDYSGDACVRCESIRGFLELQGVITKPRKKKAGKVGR